MAICKATSGIALVGSAICFRHRKEYLDIVTHPQDSDDTPLIVPKELKLESDDEPLNQMAPGYLISQVDQSQYIDQSEHIDESEHFGESEHVDHSDDVFASHTSTKRRTFTPAIQSFPKLMRSDSDRSDFTYYSQPDSQVSNASASSDIVRAKELSKFDILMSCLKEIDPTLNITHQFDLSVHERTLQEHAGVVGHIWKLIMETLTNQSFNGASASKFISMIINLVQHTPEQEKKNVSLALNILRSLRDYYQLACQDGSQSSSATKKQILLASTGISVRSANQINALSAALGARKNTVHVMAAKRLLLGRIRGLYFHTCKYLSGLPRIKNCYN